MPHPSCVCDLHQSARQCWTGPGIEPVSLWTLVRFVTTEPRRELPSGILMIVLIFFAWVIEWAFKAEEMVWKRQIYGMAWCRHSLNTWSIHIKERLGRKRGLRERWTPEHKGSRTLWSFSPSFFHWRIWDVVLSYLNMGSWSQKNLKRGMQSKASNSPAIS